MVSNFIFQFSGISASTYILHSVLLQIIAFDLWISSNAIRKYKYIGNTNMKYEHWTFPRIFNLLSHLYVALVSDAEI